MARRVCGPLDGPLQSLVSASRRGWPFDLPFLDGTAVRALARLALGETETAVAFVRASRSGRPRVSGRPSRTTPCCC